MKKVIIIMGSKSDADFAKKITDKLDTLKVVHEEHAASAHKEPKKVLEILEKNNQSQDQIVYITIAGRSNALSGFCAANTQQPVIACPPFKDKVDMMVNIHSTLQMPSNTPVLTVLDSGNAAIAAQRILDL
jgi:5-(carboxyamino)imidazole ribonucleotide mutase